MLELPKAYDPKTVENRWYSAWIEANCFKADANSDKEAYSIVIPPPNVTGILHLGHVLNNTIQDVLARRARQEGKEVLWLPGIDHAGIATQTRVEKQLRQEVGKSRYELGREKFLKEVWRWKEEHGGIIISQLKRLGCSCDWDCEVFTLDEVYSEWVSKTFSDLFKEGLIYRGNRMVNWCPSSMTALSDEEVIVKTQRSKLYKMRYFLSDGSGESIEISTTRPETLMADVAIAVHPRDKRYTKYIGRLVIRPFPETEIPIIADEHVDPEFGTGVLKITPAHSTADFEIGQRHNLPMLSCLHPDGTLDVPLIPELDGMDRLEARKKVAEKLKEIGCLVEVEEHESSIGFSERADVPIEHRLSMQWFLRYPKVEEAKRVIEEGEISFYPSYWEKNYAHWMENIQDWCISRQLWWGHRVPVWYRKNKVKELRQAVYLDRNNVDSKDIYVGTYPPKLSSEWVQDEDVLDTWFSSWLWPFATMSVADQSKEAGGYLKKFYPTNDLVTGPDILFFWVARMIMAGLKFQDQIPFRNVFFTSIIRDLKGRKMSKSLGNSPDPLVLMEEYGADGLRFGLMRISPVGMDVRFNESQIKEGRFFANKLYNACRFRQMQGSEKVVLGFEEIEELPIYHLAILAKLDQLTEQLKAGYQAFDFHQIVQSLYEFFWTDYCDHFLEAIKGDLKQIQGKAKHNQALGTIDLVLERYLQLLHPFMPYITEELYFQLNKVKGCFLMSQLLPNKAILEDHEEKKLQVAQERAAIIYQTASKIRNLKSEYGVANRKDLKLVIDASKENSQWSTQQGGKLSILAGIEEVIWKESVNVSGKPTVISSIGNLYLEIELEKINPSQEKIRLKKELEIIEREIVRCQQKLENSAFVERAPDAIINQEKVRLSEWQNKKGRLQEMLDSLN